VLGDVTNVQMIKCNGSEAFKSTVERAVMKASPLPSPPDPQVFDKKLQIRFSPKV
jgi:colicin import membrane protein